jgi:hypothetical protein
MKIVGQRKTRSNKGKARKVRSAGPGPVMRNFLRRKARKSRAAAKKHKSPLEALLG